MSRYEPAWIFNLVLKMAVVIFLSTLAIGLVAGVTPLTALMRSSAAFGVFAMLAWAVSLTWDIPKTEKVAVTADTTTPDTEIDKNKSNQQATHEAAVSTGN